MEDGQEFAVDATGYGHLRYAASQYTDADVFGFIKNPIGFLAPLVIGYGKRLDTVFTESPLNLGVILHPAYGNMTQMDSHGHSSNGHEMRQIRVCRSVGQAKMNDGVETHANPLRIPHKFYQIVQECQDFFHRGDARLQERSAHARDREMEENLIVPSQDASEFLVVQEILGMLTP